MDTEVEDLFMPINENILYKKLLTKEILKTGWHLYRRDRRQNFIEDVYAIDTLSVELEETVKEIQKRLLNGDYQARNLLRTEIPKKGLGVRPGATMTAEDSIVMNAILLSPFGCYDIWSMLRSSSQLIP